MNCNPCFIGVFYKNIASVVDLYFDWSDVFQEGETILESTWFFDADSGISIIDTDEPVDLTLHYGVVRIAGGTSGKNGKVTNEIRLSDGQVLRRTMMVVLFEHTGMVEYEFIAGRGTISATVGLTTGGTISDSYSGQIDITVSATASGGVVSVAGASDLSVVGLSTGGHVVPQGSGVVDLSTGLLTGGTVLQPGSASTGVSVQLTTGGMSYNPNASGSIDDIAVTTDSGGHVVSLGTVSEDLAVTATTVGSIVDPTPPPTPTSWMGSGYDANLRTIIDDTGYVTDTVTDNVGFQTSLTRMKQGTIDRIWLTPGYEYTWPSTAALAPFDRGALSGFDPRERPAIIETLPSALPTRAWVSNEIKWDLSYSRRGRLDGIAFRNLEIGTFTVQYGADGAHNILIEDCLIRRQATTGMNGVIGVQPVTWDGAGPDSTPTQAVNNFCLRFSFLGPTWKPSSGHSGVSTVYLDGRYEAKFEYNTFHRGGWSELHTRQTLEEDGGPTQFKHAMYFNKSPYAASYTGKNIVRYNVISEPSSHAIHMRSGGDFCYNLILKAPITQVGYQYTTNYGQWLSTGNVKGNVWVDSDNISEFPEINQPRGIGFTFENTTDFVIEENIWVYNQTVTPNNDVIRVRDANGPGLDKTSVIRNNKSYSWGTPLTEDPPSGGAILAKVDIYGNHLEDGSVTYANPSALLAYTPAAVIGQIKADDYKFTPAWIAGVLASADAAMTIT